jgi:hypothetical protein
MHELLNHEVVIGLHWHSATLVFVVLKRGGVWAMVAWCVVPVMIKWLVGGSHIRYWGWGLELVPALWCIPMVGHIVVV